MTLEKVLYPTRLHITAGWKNVLMMHPLSRIVFICLLAAQATPNTVWAQMKAAPPLSGVIGKVQSVTDSSVEVQTPSGVVHVDVKQPLTTYKQIPSDLSHVTSTSYVGVASHSRMTNGTVQKGSGTTLVVQYQDGSKTISVPASVAVTEVAPEKVTLAAGDTIYLTTDKLPNGTLTTNKILVIAPAVSPNTKQ